MHDFFKKIIGWLLLWLYGVNSFFNFRLSLVCFALHEIEWNCVDPDFELEQVRGIWIFHSYWNVVIGSSWLVLTFSQHRFWLLKWFHSFLVDSRTLSTPFFLPTWQLECICRYTYIILYYTTSNWSFKDCMFVRREGFDCYYYLLAKLFPMWSGEHFMARLRITPSQDDILCLLYAWRQ